MTPQTLVAEELTPESLDDRPAERSAEIGYIMPMTALLLIPLMIFAALATDVGAWYIKGDQAQRAADASALAAVVWLPNQTAAQAAAMDVAARNGFRDPAWTAVNGGTPNATITIPNLTEEGLQVDIVTDSPSFFGSVVLDKIDIHRRAVAAITQPVRMGNPSNGLGTGNLDSSELGITPDGVWLSINGYCQDHSQGDPISVRDYGAMGWPNRINTCAFGGATGPNPTFDADGYTFVVDVPAGAEQINIEVFEPGLCTDSNSGDLLYSAEDNFSAGPRLNFEVHANDSTALNHQDNLAAPPVHTHLYNTSDCTGGVSVGGGRWYPLYSIPAGSSSTGLWYVQASARQTTSERHLNSFALRARPASDTQLCTSQLDPTCPELYALEWLSIYRPQFGGPSAPGAGQPAEFFLADIDDDHAGSTVEITLFDPGEGMNNVQFIDPDGNEVDFEYREVNCSVGLICGNPTWPETSLVSADDCSTIPCLDVTGARFNSNWVRVESELAADYSCGGNCWWRVRYTPSSGATVTDRTTWAVRVVGGPVRLVD